MSSSFKQVGTGNLTVTDKFFSLYGCISEKAAHMIDRSSFGRIFYLGCYFLTLSGLAGCTDPSNFPLQPIQVTPGQISMADAEDPVFYVPSTPDTIKWGYLPNEMDDPVLTVPDGATVVFDTVSHEGILEDQGRDPDRYFSQHGVDSDAILDDARLIASSNLNHDFRKDGPHVVTGPIAVTGAAPGDVLRVEVLSLEPRVPYGVISNRHGKGALPGEFPETEPPESDPPITEYKSYQNVSIFTPIQKSIDGESWLAVLRDRAGRKIRFQTHPFMGVMGVAAPVSTPVHSVPPDYYGGNMDIKDLGVGAVVYFPVFVDGAKFYTGDPHMAQGNGEVALTALEQSIRATFKVSVLKNGDAQIPSKSGSLKQPFGETNKFWITMGFDQDLDEAMKKTVRESIRFLDEKLNVDRATALAYLSATTDFHVSQVVDKNKGIHALINKGDFPDHGRDGR